MKEGKGIRRGTRFWRGPDGYDYHLNRQMSGGRFSMRCTQYFLEHCSGRASVSSCGRLFRPTQPHNHDPEKFKVEERALRHALMERCRKGEHTPLRRMFHEERRRMKIGRQAASRIPLVKLRSAMNRARLENRPCVPRSLRDLHRTLSKRKYRKLSASLDREDNVYAGKFGSSRRKTLCLVFMTKRMSKYMRRVKKIFHDGTFSPVPRGLRASQVWTLSQVRRHHVIPLVRILMMKRTTAAYRVALRGIKVLVPGFDPQEVMGDWEAASRRAWESEFPMTTTNGCLFHYAKAIGVNARKLGMTKIIKKSKNVRALVRMLSILPLLPENRIQEGFSIIGRMAREKGILHHIINLLIYWSKHWGKKIPGLSVHGCEDRTSNACESDNRMLQDAVRQLRPSTWDFLDGVLEMEDTTWQDIAALDALQNPSRRRKLSAVSNDRKIRALNEELYAGTITTRRFLKRASYTVANAVDVGLSGRKRRRIIK